jgi:hypothetical protein
MSMSTRIDDLPGPPPMDRAMTPPPPPQQPVQIRNRIDETVYHEQEPTSNVTANIKRVTFAPEVEYEDYEKETLFTSIKNEINEENLFVLLIIYIATNPNISNYITKLPLIGSYAIDSTIGGFIKAIVLFVVYLLFKVFILPRIRI